MRIAGSSALGRGSGVGRFKTYVTLWPLLVRLNSVARTLRRTRSSVAHTKTGQRLGLGVATATVVGVAAGFGVGVSQGWFTSDHLKVTTRLFTTMFGTSTGVVVGWPGRSNWKCFSNG